MDSPLTYFAVGMFACVIGTIPFGPINLTVAKTTVDHSARQGIAVALAASLVEIVEALVAISFGMVISTYLDSNRLITLVLGIVFILLAGFVVTREASPRAQTREVDGRTFFLRGLVLAAANPQAIPFWIFALAAISQYTMFEYRGGYLAAFLFGVFLGKIVTLLGFVAASNYLKTHLQQSSRLVNRILAGILLFIGISQLWNVFQR